METVTLEITLPAEVHRKIKEHLATLMKPPRKDAATGAIITEPLFVAADPVSDYVAEILSVNITETLRARRDPPAELLQLQQEAEEAQRRLRTYFRPQVATNPTPRAGTESPEGGAR